MGALCGKQSSDAFDQPGRLLGTAPAPAPTAPVPASRKPAAGGPPRTLGGGGAAAAGEGSDAAAADARRRAAEAAEARAKAAERKQGKLGAQLSAQQRQTWNSTLKDAAEREVRAREMDAAGESLAHN